MMKISSEKMHAVLIPMLMEGEDYSCAVYVGFGAKHKFSHSAFNIQYGYVAVTSFNRLLVAQFNVLGIMTEYGSFPLSSLSSLDIRRGTITKIYKMKMTFNIDGKEQKLRFNASPKVFMTNLKDQEQNLNGLMDELQKWK